MAVLTHKVYIFSFLGTSPKIYAVDNQFKTLYFQTADIRSSMAVWPSTFFIDKTYKLLDIN